MKRILFFLLLFFSFSASAQVLDDTTKLSAFINSRVVTNGSRLLTAADLNKIFNAITSLMKSYAVDSGFVRNDTIFLIRRGYSTIPLKIPVGGSFLETDPTIPAFVKSLTPADTTRWSSKGMSNIFKKNPSADSVFKVINGDTSFAYLDSRFAGVVTDATLIGTGNNPGNPLRVNTDIIATQQFVNDLMATIPGGGGGGAVSSVFGRTGAVTAQAGDYNSFYPVLSGSYANPSWIASLPWTKITGAPTIPAQLNLTAGTGISVTGTYPDLTVTATGGGGGAVSSVFGRTGAVTAQASDYNSFYPVLSGSYTNPSWITSLPWTKITGAPSFITQSQLDAALNDSVEIAVGGPLIGVARPGKSDSLTLQGWPSSTIAGYYYGTNASNELGMYPLPSGGGGGAVSSVFGRTGAVTAQASDYNSFYPVLSGSYTNPSWITSLPWTKITGAPTIPAQLNLTAGTGISVTGTYPNLTVTNTGGGGGGGSSTLDGLTDVESAASSNLDMLVYNSGAWQKEQPIVTNLSTIPQGALLAMRNNTMFGMSFSNQFDTSGKELKINPAVIALKTDLTAAGVGLGNVPNVNATNAANITTGTLPDGRLSSNVVLTGSTQAMANKTLTSPLINVGSDATGDIYFRNGSGVFTRLPIGTNGQVLKVVSNLPAWSTDNTGTGTVTSVGLSMPSGFTVGSSPVTSSGTIAVTTTLNGILRGNGSGFTAVSQLGDADLSGIAWSKVTGRATTLAGYGITDAVSLTGTQTLTNKTLTAPKLNSSSTNGQVWTATGTDGSGNWTTLNVSQISSLSDLATVEYAGAGTYTVPSGGSVDVFLVPSGTSTVTGATTIVLPYDLSNPTKVYEIRVIVGANASIEINGYGGSGTTTYSNFTIQVEDGLNQRLFDAAAPSASNAVSGNTYVYRRRIYDGLKCYWYRVN
jgi:hypothetical protein